MQRAMAETTTTTTGAAKRSITASREGDGHPAVALALLLVTLAIAVAALVLVIINRPQWHVWQWYFVVDLADAFVFGTVGYLLLSRIRHPVAWVVVVCALGGALAAVGAQWTELTFKYPSAPRLPFVQSLQNWAWVPGTLALILVVPWLVRDGRPGPIARTMALIGVFVSVTLVLWRWTDPFPWPEGDPIMPLPIKDVDWLDTVLDIEQAYMGATVILGLIAAFAVARRWYAMPPEQRSGIGWLSIGALLMTISFVPLALPESWTDWMPATTTPLLHLGSQLFFPAALLVAVLGQRLWGVRLAVSRTVGWSMLTALLIGCYVVLVGLSGLLMPGVDDNVERVAVTALVAAAIGPLRRFVQRRVDHLVHGDAREPIRVVDRIGRGIDASGTPTELLVGVLEDLVTSLRLSGATIDVDDAGTSGHQASFGDITGDDEVMLPLVLDEQLIGALRVWPRPGERLDGQTDRALAALAPTVAVAAKLASTAEALSESRARISEARDEERRALRRELHDGLGPALAGVGYGLQAARNLLATDPAAAGRLLDQMVAELDARIEDVRSLARELVPPVLLENGLPAALEELAARQRMAGLDVQLSIEGAPATLPLPLTTALYGIAVEAVRNVVRHAGATSCRLSLTGHPDGRLVMTVTDNGVGIPPHVEPGVGLQSMRERAEAIGASLTVAAAEQGGTRVELRTAAAVST
jgi:signal transduction histidine kinase